MPYSFAAQSDDAIPLYLLEKDGLEPWLKAQPEAVQAWVTAAQFDAGLGEVLNIPDAKGGIRAALAGYGTASTRKRGRFHLAAAAAKLSAGTYRLVTELSGSALQTEALGWLLSQYVFDRYAPAKGTQARLVAPEGVDGPRLEAIAAGEARTRDLINTPANDMGPVALEAAASEIAQEHGADIRVIRGEALLEEGFPLIHTVGRASAEAPRLIDMCWGDAGSKLTLVGKGVCFDTGG